MREDSPYQRASAREQDHITSHMAAAEAEESGNAGCQRAKCMEFVRLYPGLTSAEIANAAGMNRQTPARRLPELRNLGKVSNLENANDRKCTICGRMSMTWWPT